LGSSIVVIGFHSVVIVCFNSIVIVCGIIIPATASSQEHAPKQQNAQDKEDFLSFHNLFFSI
jgi:hypothetical protein